MDNTRFSYFPGCSMATTAKENNASLIKLTGDLGITITELEDWNCCGSSSAHSIDEQMADRLAMRNLSLAPSDRPLLVMPNLPRFAAPHYIKWLSGAGGAIS